MDQLSSQDELRPLEYARAQGLCIDYTTEPLPLRDLSVLSATALDESLCSLSDFLTTDAASTLTKERLAVNRDAVLLLKTIYADKEEPSASCFQTDNRKCILDLKHELPVLQSDHDVDSINFGSVAPLDFRNLKIPSELVNEQNDEGLEWPAIYLTYLTQCDAQAKTEKLVVSRSTLLHLQEAIRDAYVPEDSEALKAKDGIYNRDLIIRPLTPPLLPLSPLPEPYIPSSPTNNLPLVSDSSDSVRAETEIIQSEIMAADSLTRKESDSSDSMLLDMIHPLSFSPLSEACAQVPSKRKFADLKVEGPLTPSVFSTSPMKKLKSVSFATALSELISYEPWGQDNADGDDDITSEDYGIFAEIEPLAEKVSNSVGNEQLSGADTTARVDVPYIDSSLPVAPWIECSRRNRDNCQYPTELESQTQFLRRIKREELKLAPSWHAMSVPERELQWGFLTTKISTLKLEETLHGETEMKRILSEARTGSIATSFTQVWKRDGLRILDEDDEDELESVLDEDSQDMQALLNKRKLELEEDTIGTRHKPTVSQRHLPAGLETETTDTSQQLSQEQISRLKPTQKTKDDDGSDFMFGGFSATSALHRFLETRGKAAGSVISDTVEKSFPNKSTRSMDIPKFQASTRLVKEARNEIHKAHLRDDEKRRTANLPPSPTNIPADLQPCSFLISSKFLQQRSLLKQIEKIYPNAEMVYRDYILPHSPAKDADMILSPSTGLILTSLQQIKQRALPGQIERSQIKECLATLQLRYERLIVLISEGLSRESEKLGSSRPEDPRDSEALRAIEKFTSNLEGDVLVQYVPGGEKALARATVTEMGKYGLPYGSADIGDIKPIAQETTYEVFLRRAGLNPFAAQVIVALLKKPITLEIPLYSSSPFAVEPKHIVATRLSRFLIMSKDERVHLFQALMGGSRVLKRVSDRLDQEWISAAHGFRM
ncbi:hypothetical protein COCMIDRAFT_31917 [Bipolaris oryzae ATCC 44560]|uniref:Uncharacterized protein n=1 Tax=Bipolaris oryzae ATCC 44560 TaxID=930090 RepID=W6ZL85_COCMI|nr:uncharacterized protein COCMIDRAFT_31917 [Bipolaris oryzae ATCC 44560]EUC50713.1 hypothetical protein COCMIDRAFT_31917 [Bipolaris oryzae ATCC 44560]